MPSRGFYNGRTGREEVWLEEECTHHKLFDGVMQWSECNYYVSDIDDGGKVTKHLTYDSALEDYESRVTSRTKDNMGNS